MTARCTGVVQNRPGMARCLLVLIIFACLFAAECRGRVSRKDLMTRRLVGVDLSGFDLYNLNLEGINLTRANLVGTNFSFTRMHNAILVNADLRSADLSGADLTGSDLRGANCRRIDGRGTVFRNANLVNAYFYHANLSGADLRGALLELSPKDPEEVRTPGLAPESDDSTYYAHFRDADFRGTAVSVRWREFIRGQRVRNFDKIIWVR